MNARARAGGGGFSLALIATLIAALFAMSFTPSTAAVAQIITLQRNPHLSLDLTQAGLRAARPKRELLQAAPDQAPTGASGGTAPHSTAGATLPGDITAVRSCLPYNILILPGSGGAAGGGGGNATAGGGNATILLTADFGVINGTDITYSQMDGILALQLSKGYETNRIINLTITTAANNSLRYVQNFGPGNVIVGPGFTVDDFSVAATSIGGVLAQGLNATTAYITNTGVGTVILNGTFGGADIIAGGTAKVFLAGNTTGNVTVTVDGISTTWVQGSSSSVISGTANGLAKVLYKDGTCRVQPAFQSIFGISVFGDPCQKASAGSGPTSTPTWSCGQRVDGQSSCPVESATPSSGGGGGGGGGVGLGSSGSSSTGGGGGTTTSPSGGGSSTGGGGGGTTTSPSGGNVNTVSGQPGSVTTGTFTTPGGTASASGTVSGPSGGLSGQQTSTGGSPPAFTASAFPPISDFFNTPAFGNGLDPDFMGIGSTGGSSAGAFSSATSTGGSPTSSATTAAPPPAATGISTTAQNLGSALNIPATGSGLSIVSITCNDAPNLRAVLGSVGTGTGGD